MTKQEPGRAALQIVKLTARTLPASHRERYRREFTAELHFVPGADQLRYAVHVLSRTWSLRAALIEPAPATIGGSTLKNVPARPLSCRLNLWHHWRWYFTEDGDRYQACARCGKDKRPWPSNKNSYFPWSG